MKVKEPFGIVTGCHAGDRSSVVATLASIRHYMPHIPVCLVVDGDVDVSDLEQLYKIIILRVEELDSEPMRDLIRGTGRAKLAAMWEGPFDFYVWLDADAIVWGDFTAQVRRDLDFQIFWPEISIPSDADEVPPWLAHFYFKLDELKEFDPDFEWRGHPYFSAGAFACRRNVITYDEWIKIEKWNDDVPGGIFKFWEQGMLVYLILAKSNRGEINVDYIDLQWTRSFGREDIDKDCAHAGLDFPENVGKPMIVHFCGRKPFIFDFGAYTRPFTIARLAHHRQSRSLVGAWLVIILEDGGVFLSKVLKKIKRVLSLS